MKRLLIFILVLAVPTFALPALMVGGGFAAADGTARDTAASRPPATLTYIGGTDDTGGMIAADSGTEVETASRAAVGGGAAAESGGNSGADAPLLSVGGRAADAVASGIAGRGTAAAASGGGPVGAAAPTGTDGASAPSDGGEAAAQAAEPPAVPRDAEVGVRLLNTRGEVETVTLDYYLARVVAAEMPPSFPVEALKAQAVAARTLFYNRRTAAEAGRGKHKNADVCASAACCTAYVAPTDASCAAVADTDGVVMLDGGEPILAVFHSSSGGMTRSSADVWGGTLDYLTPVSSPDSAYGKRGHGVGMSQYGAKAMADAGSTFDEILTHYYSGVAVTEPSTLS